MAIHLALQMLRSFKRLLGRQCNAQIAQFNRVSVQLQFIQQSVVDLQFCRKVYLESVSQNLQLA